MNVSSRHVSASSRRVVVFMTILVILSLFTMRPVTTSTVRAQAGTPATTGQAAACASVTDSATTVKLGAVVPLTGRYASGGEQIKNGYQLAVDDINGAGGVVVNCQRMKLELTILDDSSDPTKTVQNMETLYSSNQVVAYLGGFGSDLHAAAAAIAEKNKTPYLGVAFALYSIHQKGFKYLFSPFPKTPDLVKTAFDMLDSLSPKPTKVGLFAEKTDWGTETHDLWAKEAQARGYQLTTDQTYAPGAKDFSTMILQAKTAGTQVIWSLPNPPDGLAMLKQMKELAYAPQMMFVIRAADGAAWVQNLGKDGDYVLNMPGWNAQEKFPGVSDMDSRYQAKFNAAPQATVGPAYAVIQILADALTRAGSLDRDAIRDAIAATNLQNTVIGPVSFNPDGTGKVVDVVNQYQSGKQVLIWPKDQAVGTVMYPAKAFSER